MLLAPQSSTIWSRQAQFLELLIFTVSRELSIIAGGKIMNEASVWVVPVECGAEGTNFYALLCLSVQIVGKFMSVGLLKPPKS